MDPSQPTGSAPRVGARIGIDVGEVRIGVALSDPCGLLATPLETVAADRGGDAAIDQIVGFIVEHQAFEVVVGLPRSLSGHLGPAARKATAFAESLDSALVRRGLPVSVRLVDERLTTVSAERVLRERGRKGARRRAVVDQAAAVVILQHALDNERSTGQPPGQTVRRKS